MATAIGKDRGHPRTHEIPVVVGTPELIYIRGGSHPITIVGQVPATASLTVEYTLSHWSDMDDGSAVWVDAGLTFNAGAIEGQNIGFPVNGLRLTATTLDCTVQAMV